jgi:hypothetical protein
MLAALGDPGRTPGERPGEVRLNTSSDPSRAPRGAGRVTAVPQTRRKRPPLIVVLAVVVPALALAVAVAVRSASSDEQSSTATTLVQDGDPAAAEPAGDDEEADAPAASEDPATTTTTSRKGEGSGDAGDPAETDQGEPSPPGTAGSEGDRPTTSYPQPTVPPGGCDRPSGTAVITLGNGPSPACLALGGDQPVVFRNRTGKEISIVAVGLNEVVAAGAEARVGVARDAFGDGRSTFWSPGNPSLSGVVEVG